MGSLANNKPGGSIAYRSFFLARHFSGTDLRQ
jgi:hypothetical protein